MEGENEKGKGIQLHAGTTNGLTGQIKQRHAAKHRQHTTKSLDGKGAYA